MIPRDIEDYRVLRFLINLRRSIQNGIYANLEHQNPHIHLY
jgi:hypothetical protein